MKSTISSLLLAICLVTPLFSCSSAEASLPMYATEYYTVQLPEAVWVVLPGANGITYYFRYYESEPLNGMVMFLSSEMDMGLSDSMYSYAYDSIINGIPPSAVDGVIEQQDSMIGGHISRWFSYNQQTGGSTQTVVGNCVLIDNHALLIAYSDVYRSFDELNEVVQYLSDNTVYKGDTSSGSSFASDTVSNGKE